MAKNPLVEHDFYPPFEGFPREGIAFLGRLKKNNNRPWFQKHKGDYEDLVRFPMQCFVASLGERMAHVAPEFSFDPKRSIFRIYRDTRFSRNKTPYKTNIAASFNVLQSKGPIEKPGFYVGIEPGEIFIGGGLYLPTGVQLKGIRQALDTHPGEFLDIVRGLRFKKRFKSLMGEQLKTAPIGYPKDHPLIQYLRYKQWFVGVERGHTACFKASFVDDAAAVLVDALPFIRWLLKAAS
jgi:uncharacterized protein (TIGR02453 family)